MQFPENDRFWHDTFRFVQPYLHSEDRVTAPNEFRERLQGTAFYSYQSLNLLKPELDWAILHKGMLGDLPPSALQRMTTDLRPVFCNEVFVVLSSRADLEDLDPSSPHIASFRDLLKQIYDNQPAEPNSPATAFSPEASRFSDLQNDLCTLGIHSSAFQLPVGQLTSLVRATTQTCYLGQETVLCRVLGKYLAYVDSQDMGISPHLIMDGFWEIWTTLAMRRQLERGMYCIDVGANHGYYSLIMAAAAGPQGRVACVEPFPRLATLLSKTMELNGFMEPTVEIVSKAVTGTSGQRTQLVRLPDRSSMNASIRTDLLREMELVAEVDTISIDDLTESWPRVDLIKIDAEGAEEDIWAGMQGSILRNPQMKIFMEINCARYADPESFLRNIASRFQLRHVDFDGQVKELSISHCLGEHPASDKMLFLANAAPGPVVSGR